MRDELEKLELAVTDLSRTAIDYKFTAEWKESVILETDRIRRAFGNRALGIKKEKLVELYIQYHQLAIVKLIDRVVDIVGTDNIKETHKKDEELKSGPEVLYQCLEQLLSYIEKHFSKYFNQNAKSPESYRFVVHRELADRLPDIRYGLERKGINKRLLSIVLNPFDNFLDDIYKEEASYRKIIYLKELMLELEEIIKTPLTDERFDFKICLSLGYLNFNAQKFYKFCVREITRIVQDQPTLHKQIEKLAYLTKVINQLQNKPGFIFNEKFASIKDQLGEWLMEEIYFLEKRQQLAINFPLNSDEPVQANFKLKLGLSVPQVAYLLRCLKELDIIQNNNMLEVIKFISGIIQTKQTESVSWDSLRTKFYNVEKNARTSIRDIAQSLLSHVQKEQKSI